MEAVKVTPVFPITSWQGKRVTVFGLGRSGRAAADLLLDLGALVTIVEEQPSQDFESTSKSYGLRGAQVFRGDQVAEGLRDLDLLVVSPGVSKDHLLVQEIGQRGIPIIGEIELAGWFLQAPIIAVTGTNGKSTTVRLIGSILQQSGKRAFVGGNLGIPLCEAVPRPTHPSPAPDYEYIVAEVSSFQLETIHRFKPWIAALLNVTPDHLDRHPTQEEYRAAKQRIFENQTSQDWALINVDDPVVKTMALSARSGLCEFSLIQKVKQGVYLEGADIRARMHGKEFSIVRRDALPMRGDHNVANAMAAMSVSLLCGCSVEDMVLALQSTPTFEHALEVVREWQGITFVNDSKGTNVDATLKALHSFEEPLVLILGGKDKGGDFSQLADTIKRQVKGVVVIGEATQKIIQALDQIKPVALAASLEDAVSQAAAFASKGDVVLFSPACASFDMFRNYHHRGLEFKRVVGELQ
ncbi:MAG: UDP-N-acetylmuramoyl-L-alanine--D-glutamate ligase [Nitrospirota bacterium]|nr:UDP-N-acetylmuramoyl-L-alanine--D-glutamate ligase [Nitrospirota bacterium]MDH4359424.1 UDP-N-acetylmuramoyl-L-alanine--D-glutamate ligase [Nitrospirota bacterium]